MSSSDLGHAHRTPGLRKRFLTLVSVLGLAVVAGCTVRPLYGDVTSATGPQAFASARLESIEIAPVDDRVGQEVRNHLIFLLGGGKGQPASPAYKVQLSVRATDARASSINTSRVNLDPTSGIVTVQGSYVLTDASNGERISAGRRSVQAPYDIPRQEFAALRAVRNAEDRASRELAEVLRLALAQELEQSTSKVEPAEVPVSPEEAEKLGQDASEEL